jgi:hypothetical protein
MDQSVLGFISEARVHLPKPGEADEKSRASKFFSEAKDHTRLKERQLSDWLESEGVLDDLDEQGKWAILGFTDKESFDDFIYPKLHQLIQGADPMIADLARRLLRDPAFTPVELAGEGYQKAIVMDLLNALLREHWAIWTDLSVLGERAKGTVTQVGQRLLRKLVDVDCKDRITFVPDF